MEYDIEWEDPISNINYLEKINNLPNQIELIILPEMFTTGFTKNAANFAESMKSHKVDGILTFEKMCFSRKHNY